MEYRHVLMRALAASACKSDAPACIASTWTNCRYTGNSARLDAKPVTFRDRGLPPTETGRGAIEGEDRRLIGRAASHAESKELAPTGDYVLLTQNPGDVTAALHIGNQHHIAWPDLPSLGRLYLKFVVVLIDMMLRNSRLAIAAE